MLVRDDMKDSTAPSPWLPFLVHFQDHFQASNILTSTNTEQLRHTGSTLPEFLYSQLPPLPPVPPYLLLAPLTHSLLL